MRDGFFFENRNINAFARIVRETRMLTAGRLAQIGTRFLFVKITGRIDSIECFKVDLIYCP